MALRPAVHCMVSHLLLKVLVNAFGTLLTGVTDATFILSDMSKLRFFIAIIAGSKADRRHCWRSHYSRRRVVYADIQ